MVKNAAMGLLCLDTSCAGENPKHYDGNILPEWISHGQNQLAAPKSHTGN